MFYRVPWRWRPDIDWMRGCSWSACWGFWAIEWISKEWLDYCERKWSGLGTVMDWVDRESSDERDPG